MTVNEHDEIGTGGRVDPDDITIDCDPDELPIKGRIDKTERWYPTSRAARRAHQHGHKYDKPKRSRCQRKTPKQRAFWPGAKAVERKNRRRADREAAAAAEVAA